MIALDLSRLLSRAGSATPTGIDRVELAYARHLAGNGRPHCCVARNALGAIGLLSATDAAQFVVSLAALWRDGTASQAERRVSSLARRLRRAALFSGKAALREEMRRDRAPAVYLLVSHQHLDQPRPIARLKATTGARLVCLIHDLIPLEFPHLTRPGQERRHRRRIATTAALADAVIVNSVATGDALRDRLGGAPRDMPVVVAPLGIDLTGPRARAAEGRPYFVCVGTIEARKNHRLLFELWRRLARDLGDRAPRLLLIGQRGFGGGRICEEIAALGGLVVEHAGLPDAAMAPLLRGARALLLPSLAEGFGLPVAEALAAGVPVLCSELPALRETGGSVPDYLDPADIDGWHRGILDFVADSPRRRAQLARLAGWRPPDWEDHFAIVDRLIDAFGQAPGPIRTYRGGSPAKVTRSMTRR